MPQTTKLMIAATRSRANLGESQRICKINIDEIIFGALGNLGPSTSNLRQNLNFPEKHLLKKYRWFFYGEKRRERKQVTLGGTTRKTVSSSEEKLFQI